MSTIIDLSILSAWRLFKRKATVTKLPMELQTNKMILAAAILVATIASGASASAMQIAGGTVHFPPHTGPATSTPAECRDFVVPAGVQVRHQLVSFSEPVANAVAVITGWDAYYVFGDHHFGRLTVTVGIVGAPVGNFLHVRIA
jgi:hypothetical protein